MIRRRSVDPVAITVIVSLTFILATCLHVDDSEQRIRDEVVALKSAVTTTEAMVQLAANREAADYEYMPEILPSLSDAEFCRRAYLMILGREPDPGRMRLESEAPQHIGIPSRRGYIMGLLDSDEFKHRSWK